MRHPLALVAAAAVIALTGTLVAAPAEAAPKTVSVRALLAKLAVRAEDHAHPYRDASRARFLYDQELDADDDGCWTRKEVLIRDALHVDHVSRSCAVYGRWRSLYDGRVTTDPGSLEIDHLVALAEAWHSGAWAWSHRRQIAFGNDVDYRWELQAVTSAANQDKRSDDPAEWLPPKNRCTYVAAWVGVKSRWSLPVDPAEKRALLKQLDRCGALKVEAPGRPDIDRLVGSGRTLEKKQ